MYVNVCAYVRDEGDDALRQLMGGDGEDDIPKVRIEDLVNEMLSTGKHSLSLLTESEVAQVSSSSSSDNVYQLHTIHTYSMLQSTSSPPPGAG